MSCFFAIVPLMLCAIMSQAAPTVTNSNPQTQAQNTSMEVGIPDAESLLSNIPPPEAVSVRLPSTPPISNSNSQTKVQGSSMQVGTPDAESLLSDIPPPSPQTQIQNPSMEMKVPDAESLLSDIPPPQTQIQNPSMKMRVPNAESLLSDIPPPQTQNPSIEMRLPDAESLLQTIPPPPPLSVRSPSTASPPPQHPSQPVQCPAQAPPCPPACIPPEPNPAPAKVTENPPQKKTGWVNGFKNVINVCYKAVYEGVGKEGFLTNLVYKTGDARTKKPKKSAGSAGNTKACCVFYNSPPPHVNDEDDDDEKPRETSITVPPVNCFWIKSKTSTPGAPPVTPLVPGATTNSKSDHVNCCCVGERLVKIVHCVDLRVRPQFNCCALTVNASVVE